MSSLAPGQTARAIYDYEARAADELSFKRNDIINVLGADEEDEGWYRGEIAGRAGLFPNNYVQLIPMAPVTPSAPSAPTNRVPDHVRTEEFDKVYTLQDALGRGRFSQVRRATLKSSGQSYAVKLMDLTDPELGATVPEAEKEVLSELEVLYRLQHPGVVELFECFKWKSKYFLVMEDLRGGDLFDRIEQQGPFNEADAGPLVRQVVSAIAFLHERGIAHRDIKPDNLVFESRDSDSAIKLIDFGYAGRLDPNGGEGQLVGLCGTPDYAAPEILSWYSADKSKKPNGTPYNHAVDMWSMGVVLYILLCGFPPFYGDDDDQMFSLIRTGSYSFPAVIDNYKTAWAAVSKGAQSLISSMLTVQPSARVTAAAVLGGEWMAEHGGRKGWVGKMRERSISGWGGGKAPSGESSARADRGQIDRGTAPPRVNTDAKMVFGDDAKEGKLGYSLNQPNVVSQFSRWIVDRMFQKKEMRILMLGLDNSGKTSILYRLKLGQPKKTIPTIGFNVETLEYKSIAFTVWDVGGQEKLRSLWRHYYANTQALIFVVDSSDRARIQEAAEELHRLIKEEELHDALLLVFANKQDLPGAANAAEVSEEMRLYPPYISKSCYIQSCCAQSGDGLHAGLDWLSSNFEQMMAEQADQAPPA